MPNDTDPRWLTAEEDATWRSLWAVMTWLPVRLEAQLRADAGLALVEYHVLSQLSEAPERTLRLSRLAVATNTTLSHLSRVMTRLEQAGWVERFPDPSDGRSTLGRLTDAGWAKVEQSAPAHVEAVRQVLFDQLTGEQARQLGRAAALVADAVAPESARSRRFISRQEVAALAAADVRIDRERFRADLDGTHGHTHDHDDPVAGEGEVAPV